MASASTWAYTMSCSEIGSASARRVADRVAPRHPEVVAEVLAVLVAGDEVAHPVGVPLGKRLVEVEVLADLRLEGVGLLGLGQRAPGCRPGRPAPCSAAGR